MVEHIQALGFGKALHIQPIYLLIWQYRRETHYQRFLL